MKRKLNIQAQIQKPTPKWMLEQIEQDLAPFQHELSQVYLDELFANHGEEWYLVRIRVQNGNMLVEPSLKASKYEFTHLMVHPILQLHDSLPLPEIDFILCMNDVFKTHVGWPTYVNAIMTKDASLQALPLFMIAKHKEDPGMILIPDWYALEGFEPQKSQILTGTKKFPWELKKQVLFFRGTDNGAFDRIDWRNNPRIKLVDLSSKFSDLIDAKFFNLNCWEESSHIRDSMEAEGMLAREDSHIPLSDALQYRYLLAIDGHTCAIPRTALWLQSNSVTFKQMTHNVQWFYLALKAYEHFIPIANDLSDILSQIEWAKNHDKECNLISQNARELTQEFLTKEAIYLYLYRLFEAYAHKQKIYYR